MPTIPRPYLSDAHLRFGRFVVESSAGRIALWPLRATSIYFDAAKANHMPRNLPEGEHGSSVIDIGGGVTARLSGHVEQTEDGWACTRLDGRQYPTGRDLTAAQEARAREIVATMVIGWIADHGADLIDAEQIDRNNAARTLEETISVHEDALRILRRNLKACTNGKPYEKFPALPTKR